MGDLPSPIMGDLPNPTMGDLAMGMGGMPGIGELPRCGWHIPTMGDLPNPGGGWVTGAGAIPGARVDDSRCDGNSHTRGCRGRYACRVFTDALELDSALSSAWASG